MNNFQQNQNWNQNNQQTSQSANQQQTNFQAQSNAQTQPNQPSGLIQTLLTAALPALMQHFMGQTMPPMGGGNNVEMQLALSQVTNLLQNLDQRLAKLENSSSQQFLNLAQEVKSIKSIRLTHDRERKQIEFNQNLENHEN